MPAEKRESGGGLFCRESDFDRHTFAIALDLQGHAVPGSLLAHSVDHIETFRHRFAIDCKNSDPLSAARRFPPPSRVELPALRQHR